MIAFHVTFFYLLLDLHIHYALEINSSFLLQSNAAEYVTEVVTKADCRCV